MSEDRIYGVDAVACGCGVAVIGLRSLNGTVVIERTETVRCERHEKEERTSMKIEIVQGDAAQAWHARIRGANGEIVATTEQYFRRSSAIAAVAVMAETFGAKGAWTVEGPPGNALLVFRSPTSTLNTALARRLRDAATSELRYPLYDIDERKDRQ